MVPHLTRQPNVSAYQSEIQAQRTQIADDSGAPIGPHRCKGSIVLTVSRRHVSYSVLCLPEHCHSFLVVARWCKKAISAKRRLPEREDKEGKKREDHSFHLWLVDALLVASAASVAEEKREKATMERKERIGRQEWTYVWLVVWCPPEPQIRLQA